MASSEPIPSFFFEQDGLHEDAANPGPGAAAVVGGAEFEGAVCRSPRLARADGRHGVVSRSDFICQGQTAFALIHRRLREGSKQMLKGIEGDQQDGDRDGHAGEVSEGEGDGVFVEFAARGEQPYPVQP